MPKNSAHKFRNRYRIPSARAQWHDYNGGAYFITICTKNQEHYFGSISDGKMHYSEIGTFVDENMKNITAHYPYAEIPLFVVMPNHLHAVVIINPRGNRRCRDVARNVSTRSGKPISPKMAEIATHQSLLTATVRGFKSAITKFANQNKIDFSWQARFYDRIIRNANELNLIGNYIETNIIQWESDCPDPE